MATVQTLCDSDSQADPNLANMRTAAGIDHYFSQFLYKLVVQHISVDGRYFLSFYKVGLIIMLV